MPPAQARRPLARSAYWLALLMLAFAVALGGCRKDSDQADTRTAAELYEEAKAQLDRKAYDRAVQSYRALAQGVHLMAVRAEERIPAILARAGLVRSAADLGERQVGAEQLGHGLLLG